MRIYKAWVIFEDGHFRFIEKVEASSEENARNILSKEWSAATKIDVEIV